MLLRHKVALVTGAAHGIGRAVALQFAREGAAVLVSDRCLADAQASADGLRALGARVLVVAADVDRAGDIQHLVERCCAHFGRLDIACNLTGAAGVQGLRYQIEAMLRTAGGGAVVNVASAAVHGAPDPWRPACRRGLRDQWRSAVRASQDLPTGVRVNTLAHGLIAGGTVPTLFSATAGTDTDRVAELVAWLASDRAGGISGAFYPLEDTEAATA